MALGDVAGVKYGYSPVGWKLQAALTSPSHKNLSLFTSL